MATPSKRPPRGLNEPVVKPVEPIAPVIRRPCKPGCTIEHKHVPDKPSAR